ncbi:MAG: HNH endonuclease family protein [Rhodobacteraceae bacterium]|nr:HNH endonuclease family protein [Paracoccaceae bacterium]
MALAAIEACAARPRMEMRARPEPLQIEHIMPQGWNNTHWPLAADDPEAVERRNTLFHVIGKLTLVTGPLNRMLSNAPRDTMGDYILE